MAIKMKIFKHFCTITHHRLLVCKHCFKVGLIWQGLTHDLSKYSFTEFFRGAKYYDGHKSPNEVEREKKGYSEAWMHHKGRNKHHFEYWTDYSKEEGRYIPVKMPLKYVKEMFCDRVAASKVYKGKEYTDSCPFEYFTSRSKVDVMHKDTYDLLYKLLLMLKEKGEKETFKYIKSLKEY